MIFMPNIMTSHLNLIIPGINSSYVTRLLLTFSFYVAVRHYLLRIPRMHIFCESEISLKNELIYIFNIYYFYGTKAELIESSLS